MKIINAPNYRLVKRYHRGHCWAVRFAPGTPDRDIEAAIHEGEAYFFPYDEGSDRFTTTRYTRRFRF